MIISTIPTFFWKKLLIEHLFVSGTAPEAEETTVKHHSQETWPHVAYLSQEFQQETGKYMKYRIHGEWWVQKGKIKKETRPGKALNGQKFTLAWVTKEDFLHYCTYILHYFYFYLCLLHSEEEPLPYTYLYFKRQLILIK